MTQVVVNNITSGYNLSKFNNNFTNLSLWANNVALSNAGGNNVMHQDFDMNSNDILNANTISATSLMLGGTAVVPSNLGSFAPNSVGTIQIVDGSVTDNKIVSVSGNKASFIHSGLGAVSTNLQARGRLEVRVEDYGAVADYDPINDIGTDNTAAYQAAYNYLVSKGGGTLRFSSGNYMGKITITDPYIKIQGEAEWATNLYNVDNTYVISISNSVKAVSHCGVSKLTIRNRNAATYTGVLGIYINGVNPNTNCDFNSFRELYILSMSSGIYLTGRTIWNHWDSVRVAGSNSANLTVNATDNAGAQTWINCRFGASAQHGILVVSANASIPTFNWAFYGCTVEQNLYNGLRITGSGAGIQAWTFNNCYFEENAYSVAPGGSLGLVRANVFVDGIQNMLGLVFDNCTFYGDSSPQPNMDYGIYVNTTGMTTALGEVRASRFGVNTIKDIFWLKGLTYSNNIYSSGVSTQRGLGSVSIQDLGQGHLPFTPSIAFGGNSVGITYSNQVGRYIQLGNICFFEIYLSLTSKGTSVGAMTVQGLPFPTSNAPASLIPSYSVHGDLFAAGVTALQARSGIAGSTQLEVNKLTAGSAVALADTDFGNSTRFSVSGFYFTA